MNLNEQFLVDMDKVFPNHSFYTLRNRTEEKSKPIHIDKNQIQVWNWGDKKGCIYYTPNGEYALANWVRQLKNAQRMFSLFVEIDFDTPDDKLKLREGFQFQPSIVIETYKWYHVYWLIEPVQYDDVWKQLQSDLCGFFGGDPYAKDWARMLRVPWTRYWKDLKWETIMNVIVYDITKKYNIRDFTNLFSPFDKIEKEKNASVSDLGRTARDLVDEIDRACDVVDVLHQLSWTWEVCSDGSIKESGKTTDWYKWYKDKNALVRFSDHSDRPQWWPFSVAKHLLGSVSEAFKFFRDRYNIWYEQQVKPTQVRTDEESKIVKLDYSGGSLHFDTTKWLTYAEIITKDGSNVQEVMTWVIKPIGYFTDIEDIINFIVYYKTNTWREGYMTLRELGRSSELEKRLSQVWITFFVWSRHKARLKMMEYICGSWDEYQYINSAGGTGTGMYICKSWKYFVKQGDKRYYIEIESMSNSEMNLFDVWKSIDKEEFMKHLKRIEDSYLPTIAITSALRYGMSLFVNEIRSMFKCFPILNYVGMSQAGKTTLRRTLMEYFWCNPHFELQASTTEFVLMNMTKHALPLNIGEFENADRMRVDWDSFLKNNYDGTKNARGTAWQKMITYPNISPIVIDWEIKSMNNAVNTRSFVLFFNPLYKWWVIEQKEIVNINGYLISQYKNIWKMWWVYQEKRKQFQEVMKDSNISEKERIINNYAMLSAFAYCMNIDGVDDKLIEQMKTQISTMGSNTIEKTIRLVFSMAMWQNMSAYIEESTKSIVVETVMDSLKYNASKIDEIKSKMQIVNHHFHLSWWGSMEDDLRIPLDYLMGNEQLHSVFTKMLNYIARKRPITSGHIGSTLKMFAEKNNFKHEAFYEDAQWSFGKNDLYWKTHDTNKDLF